MQLVSSSLRKTVLAFAALSCLTLATTTASAKVVWSGPVDIVIPTTFNGLTVNVATGTTNLPAGGNVSTIPGWDFNIYSPDGLDFQTPGTVVGKGDIVLSRPFATGNLAFGELIGASSTFGTGYGVAQWNRNSSDNIFGFRFINEATGSLHYGWGRLGIGYSVTDPSRALLEYAYELTPGLAIQAGVVPEPGTYALMVAGGLAIGLAARRRRAN